MAELSGKDDTSELLAIVKMNDLTPDEAVKKLSDNPAILLFDRPSNCGNLGTIIRTCDSFGIELLITTGHAVDPYEPATVTSTMGSFFCIPHLHIAENDALLEFIGKLREKYGKLNVYGSTAHKQHPDLGGRLQSSDAHYGRKRNLRTQCGVQGNMRYARDHSHGRDLLRKLLQRGVRGFNNVLRDSPPEKLSLSRLIYKKIELWQKKFENTIDKAG